MSKLIIGFLSGMFLTGSLFQFDIGLPNFHKTQIKKSSKLIKNYKKKFKKGVLKRATIRAASIAAETAIPIPIITTGIAVTTVIAITANEHCENQNTLDNIALTLEGGEVDKEKEASISECSSRVYQDAKSAVIDSGSGASQWFGEQYNNASDWWASDQWSSEDK